MKDIMVDLETLGKRSGAAIISIGAVAFDMEKGEIGDTFYCVVNSKTNTELGFHADPDTVKWWSEQEPAAREILTLSLSETDSLPTKEALEKLTTWMFSVGSNLKIWGCGSDFDNVILAEAYRLCDLPQPWSFWNNRCYRTIKSMAPHIKMKREGTYHNALDDAISQAKHLNEIMK